LAQGEAVSILDLTGNRFPAAIEIRLEKDYTFISCFVEGASINRGSSEFTSDFQAGSQRLRGRVAMDQADDVFDKLFRFEAVFDQPLLQAAPASAADRDNHLLTVDSHYELPIPEGCQSVSQGKSPYRTTINAQIDIPLSSLVDFYRREVPRHDWTEDPATAESSEGRVRMVFASDSRGPLGVTLQQEGQSTSIELIARNEKKATEDKIAPAEGQGLLLLANASDAPVVVTLGRRTVNLPAGKGAEDPKDAVRVPVLPGKHRLTVGSGANASREEVTVEVGTTWGVVAVPGGGVFAEVLY
jgi:hypothetical protein